MATITWLGERDGQDTNTWNGYTFQKGVPVEVSDPYMITTARGNKFYEVKGEETKDDKAAETWKKEQVDLHSKIDDERKQSVAHAFEASTKAAKERAEIVARRRAEDEKAAEAKEPKRPAEKPVPKPAKKPAKKPVAKPVAKPAAPKRRR